MQGTCLHYSLTKLLDVVKYVNPIPLTEEDFSCSKSTLCSGRTCKCIPPVWIVPLYGKVPYRTVVPWGPKIFFLNTFKVPIHPAISQNRDFCNFHLIFY